MQSLVSVRSRFLFQVLVFLAVMGGGLPAGAQSARYVDAYNVLVANLNARIAVGFPGPPFALKDAARGDTVEQSELDALRSRVIDLMRRGYLTGCGPVEPTERDPLYAFGAGVRIQAGVLVHPSLMDLIGDGEGNWTQVPAEFTASGKAVYAASFSDVPPLWIHFQELDRAIRSLKYSALPWGVSPNWSSHGEDNARSGWGGYSSGGWAGAMADANRAYVNVPAASRDNRAPAARARGLGSDQAIGVQADVSRSFAYCDVRPLCTNWPHCLMFYVYAGSPSYPDPWSVTRVFDANGDPVKQDRWAQWDESSRSTDAFANSRRLGSLDRPVWCDLPAAGAFQLRGYEVNDVMVTIEWTFTDSPLVRPESDDVEDDGLCDAGCGCKDCTSQAGAAWQGTGTGGRAHLPLGISGNAAPGGLRVKAYLTQWRDHGALRAVYSLATHCTGLRAADGEWEFVTVWRPEGAEIMLSVYGREPGRPVEGGYRYRMTREGAGAYTLHFPAAGGEITHTYSASRLVAVGRKSAGHEETVGWEGAPGLWPALTTFYYGGLPRPVVAAVDSPLYYAVPVYAGDAAQRVDYHYHADGHVDTCEWYHGSDGYRATDSLGRTLDDFRIVENNGGGSGEIWRGVTTNAIAQAALKERRERWIDDATGLTLTRESVVAETGGGALATNVTLVAEQEMPWGYESITRIVGEGTAAAQMDRWTYCTNNADGANFGHLRLAEKADGGWVWYDYDNLGRVRLERSGFRDGLPADTSECRETELIYAGDARLAALRAPAETPVGRDDRPRLTIERVRGRETARAYTAYEAGLQTVKRCAVAGARYDDPANLTTLTHLNPDGAFAGRVARIERPDGTRSVYMYETRSGGGACVTEDTGSGPAGGGVSNGTRRVTVTDANQRVLSETRTDIASGLLIAATDYTLDGYGRTVVASNRVDGSVVQTEYGCCGPERSVDAEGIATRCAYDALKRPFAVERAGTITYTTYNAAGQALETRLTAAGLPDQVSQATYDAAGRLASRVDARGSVTSYTYGTNTAGGRVVTTVLPDGAFTVEDYFRNGELRCVTGTAVRATCYDYGVDEQGSYTVESHGADTNAAEWVRTRTDRLGREWRVEYPDGYARESTYDAAGRIVRESDGITTRLTDYDDLGAPVRTGVDMDDNDWLDTAGSDRIRETLTDYAFFEGRPARRTVHNVFAEAGSGMWTTVAEEWQALDGGTTWSIAFDRTARVDVARSPESATRVETATDPAGVSVTTAYSNGLPVRAERRDATGAVVAVETTAYDAFGRAVQVGGLGPDGSAQSVACGYDAGGLVTNEVRVAGDLRRETHYEYDAMGRRVRTVLPDGGTLEQTYGPAGELLALGGSSANPVQYGYDDRGRLSELRTYRNGTGGPADVTVWRYDAARGWLSAKVYADGTTNAFAYAPNGALARRTGARGVATDYAYDAAGSVTNVAYSDGTPGVAFEIDRLGRVAAVQDGLGTSSNQYAADGNLEVATFPHVEVESDYGYDVLGRRARLVLRTPSGTATTAVTYAFDAAGRVESVTAGPAATYAYAADGLSIAALSVGSGAEEVVGGCWHYDAAGRVSGLAWRTNGALWKSVAHEYDASDRVARRVREDGSAWTFGYDAVGQLTSATPDAREALTYAFDSIGNRATAGRSEGRRTDYLSNALNQYIGLDALEFGAGGFRGTLYSFGSGAGPTLQPDAPAGSAGGERVLVPRHIALSYDADGNLTNDGTRAYAWDAENRLVTVEPLAAAPGAQRVRFGYDYRARCAWRVVEVWDRGGWVGSETNRFAYDGWRVVAEVGQRPTGAYTNTYVWGLDLSGTFEGAGGIGGLLFAQFSGATGAPAVVTYAYDGNGNVVGLADAATGAPVADYEYEPFGEGITSRVYTAVGALNPYRFSTKYTDPLNGLINYGYRHYSPRLGRWINRDPLTEYGGFNLYGFVGNTPNNGVDILGLEGLEGANPFGWALNQFTVPIRVPLGLVGGFLTGDNFSFESEDPEYDADQCEFLVTVTGVRMQSRNSQIDFMKQVAELNMFSGIRNAAWVNNPSRFFMMGDIAQLLQNEVLYAVTTVDLRAARKIQGAAQAAERNGCDCWCITVVAHSQGTMIVKRALDVIDPKIKKHISIIGLGGETTFGPGDGVAFAKNIAQINDPVPHRWNRVSFWNGNDTMVSFGYKDPSQAPKDAPHYETENGSLLNYDAHSWDKVYIPYLRNHPLLDMPRCQSSK